MRQNKMSQHGLLSSRVDLMEHLDKLMAPGAISKMTLPEMLASLIKVKDEDVSLPFDLRLMVLERFVNHYYDEMAACKSHEDKNFEKHLNKWIQTCSVWWAATSGGGNTVASSKSKGDESDPNFAWALQSMMDELEVSVRMKQISSVEAHDNLQENLEACIGRRVGRLAKNNELIVNVGHSVGTAPILEF